MPKFLYVGDLHIRGTTPRNRLDDYPAAVSAKLAEVNRIAAEYGCDAILCAGDIFHSPEVAIGVLLRAFNDFKASTVPWYTTAGNHDLYGYNLATYERTSLKLLEMLLPNFHVINDPSQPVYFGKDPDVAQVTFTPFSGRMDVDGYGYSPEVDPRGAFSIHVAHGMLLDHDPPFDRFTRVQTVQTTADLVLCGHDHTGFGLYRRSDGKTFVNCGSLTRMNASQEEIARTPQVALIEIEQAPEGFRQHQYAVVTLIQLTTAKPGEDILDRSRIEAETKRRYAMEEFTALVQANTGDRVIMNVPDIVKAIADQEGYAPDVVAKAIAKIDEARMLGLK